jgi:hypothetical protein
VKVSQLLLIHKQEGLHSYIIMNKRVKKRVMPSGKATEKRRAIQIPYRPIFFYEKLLK